MAAGPPRPREANGQPGIAVRAGHLRNRGGSGRCSRLPGARRYVPVGVNSVATTACW